MACACGVCTSCRGSGFHKTTLLDSLAPTVDQIRMIAQDLGLRPYEVFLVWIRWGGTERGEGSPHLLREVLMMPSPVVTDLTGVALSPVSVGILPVGSVRLSKVSATYSADDLMGLTVPPKALGGSCGFQRLGTHYPPNVLGASGKELVLARGNVEADDNESIPEPYEFFYEIAQAGTLAPQRHRFRIAGLPFKRPQDFEWTVLLEKTSQDRTREKQVRVPEEG